VQILRYAVPPEEIREPVEQHGRFNVGAMLHQAKYYEIFQNRIFALTSPALLFTVTRFFKSYIGRALLFARQFIEFT
jgi:hypothetical protein